MKQLNKWYRILAPRPVVIITSNGPSGASNAASVSFVMPVSSDPPLVALAVSPKYHTVRNIRETREFVVNIPGKEQVQGALKAGEHFDDGIDEIRASGFTPAPSRKVAPKGLLECPARLECSLETEVETGDHVVLIGRILECHFKSETLKSGKFSAISAVPLLHISGREFCLPGEVLKCDETE